jgi:hypothetical protein
MIGTLQCVVLDCPDPVRLAEFYRKLLGGEVNRPDSRWSLEEGWATLHVPEGAVVAFQKVANFVPPQWPNPDHPQQFHIDVGVLSLERSGAEAVAAGARVLNTDYTDRGWVVYADPAGHPFCLVRD